MYCNLADIHFLTTLVRILAMADRIVRPASTCKPVCCPISILKQEPSVELNLPLCLCLPNHFELRLRDTADELSFNVYSLLIFNRSQLLEGKKLGLVWREP